MCIYSCNFQVLKFMCITPPSVMKIWRENGKVLNIAQRGNAWNIPLHHFICQSGIVSCVNLLFVETSVTVSNMYFPVQCDNARSKFRIPCNVIRLSPDLNRAKDSWIRAEFCLLMTKQTNKPVQKSSGYVSWLGEGCEVNSLTGSTRTFIGRFAHMTLWMFQIWLFIFLKPLEASNQGGPTKHCALPNVTARKCPLPCVICPLPRVKWNQQ